MSTDKLQLDEPDPDIFQRESDRSVQHRSNEKMFIFESKNRILQKKLQNVAV